MTDEEKEIFREVNQHMRNTEVKYIRLSLSFIAIVSLIITLISKADKTFDFFSGSTLNLVVYSIITLIGCVVYTKLAWFRVWKEHYIEIGNNIVSGWKITPDKTPYFLRNNLTTGFSYDKVFTYFTSLITTTIYILLSVNIINKVSNCHYTMYIMMVSVILYFIFYKVFSSNITKDKCLDA